MRNFLVLSTLLLAASLPGHADTVFNLSNNTFSNGVSATGTVSVDTVTGLFTSVDVTLVDGGKSYAFAGAPSGQASLLGSQYYEQSFDFGGNELVIDVPVASLVGYTGGELCSTSHLCDGLSGAYAIPFGQTAANVYTLTQGSLVAATPEPSSLILLGTGLATAATAARRRWNRAAQDAPAV